MFKDPKSGKWRGYNMSTEPFHSLSELEQEDAVDKLLKHLGLKILVERTPDYTEVGLVPEGDEIDG